MQDAEWRDASDLRQRFEQKRTWLVTASLAWGTLGIVYGDIGTSPLYTMASIFANVDSPDADDAKMGLSLIFWTLTIVVLFKYVLIVLRADDNGEGGTFAVYSRLCRCVGISPFGTLQTKEHEDLVTLSKRAPVAVPLNTSPAAWGLGRSLQSLQLRTSSSSPAPYTPSAHFQAPAAAPATGSVSLITTSKAAGGPLVPQPTVPEESPYHDHTMTNQGQLRSAHSTGSAVADKASRVALRAAVPGAPQEGALDLPTGMQASQTLGQPLHWWNRGALPAEPIKRWVRGSLVAQRMLLVISVFATSLVLGDGVLTPAVSMVGSISGLTVATESVTQDMVVGISIAILVVLFGLQHFGTWRIAFLFSPVVFLWLGANAAIGIYSLCVNGGEALQGLSPYYIHAFFARYGGTTGWQMLGAVMLAVTGSEALFADLGHFDVASVSISWSLFAYPCLVLTYVGQASHLIVSPEDMSSIYWKTVPTAVFWPMLVLATLATIVASQALISASFSIIKQAKALGCFPRVKVINTSEKHQGQIYVPSVNWVLMILTVAVIAGFNGDSVRLGNAYGLTISAVMLITTFYLLVVAVVDWRINAGIVFVLFGGFALVDGAFFTANVTKLDKGGWVALAIGGGAALVNLVWWAGQRRQRHVIAKLEHSAMASQPFTYVAASGKDSSASPAFPSSATAPLARSTTGSLLPRPAGTPAAHHALPLQQSVLSRYLDLAAVLPNAFDLGMLRGNLKLALKHASLTSGSPLVVMPGIALHYSDDSSSAISAVLRHIISNQEAVHEITLLVTVRRLPVPRIGEEDRLLVRTLPQLPSFYHVIARYGYFDTVEHGPDFINDLLGAVVTVLADSAGIRTSNLLADTSTVERPVAEGVMDVHSPTAEDFRAPSLVTRSRAHVNAPGPRDARHVSSFNVGTVSVGSLSRHESAAAVEIQVLGSGEHNSQDLAARSVPSPTQRMTLDLQTLSRAVQATHLGRTLSRVHGSNKPTAMLPDKDAGLAVADPMQYVSDLAALVKRGESLPPELEEAALRVSALLTAAQAGCVYYFSRTSLRSDPRSNFCSRLLMEHLYRPMLLLSHADHEEWRVPLEHLVELGMVIRV